jgi:predicted dehydrogenase
MNFCLIGYGYWGKNLLRNLIEVCGGEGLSVAEVIPAKRDILRLHNPFLRIFENGEDAIADKAIDAVVIATETPLHYALAKAALKAGKHVLVEKPLTTSYAEAQELVALAEAQGLVLMTDHTFFYHPAIKLIKEYTNQNFWGNIQYIDSVRINLGVYQNQVNVLWDLAYHDLTIINYIIQEKPHAVSATGRFNSTYKTQDLAYLFLYYPSGLLVHITASWASPMKMRKMIIGGEHRMLVYDDVEPTNKLTVFEYEQFPVKDDNKTRLSDYRLSNSFNPKVPNTEALRLVVEDFSAAVEKKQMRSENCADALEIIYLLEKAQESLLSNGAIITL